MKHTVLDSFPSYAHLYVHEETLVMTEQYLILAVILNSVCIFAPSVWQCTFWDVLFILSFG